MPSLVNGLGGPAGFGEGVLARNDDSSTGAINITSVFGEGGLNFFGAHFTSLYVNNNGNITFGDSLGEYVPEPIGSGIDVPIIAALWFDIDTRPGTGQTTSPGGTSTGSNLVYYDLDTTTHTVTITWDDVGYYSGGLGRPDAFQIQLISTGGGNFDIALIYEAVNQVSASTSPVARSGFSPGEDDSGRPLPGSFELPGSGTGAEINLATTVGNTGVAGYWLFHVSGGVVTDAGTPPTPPPPASFSLSGTERHLEGDSGVTPFSFTIHRTATDMTLTSVVNWQLMIAGPDATGGGVANAADFAPGQPLSGTVTFASGQTDATVTINVQGDRTFERDEVFQFGLNGATHGTDSVDATASATGIIQNDDPATLFLFTGPQYRLDATDNRPMDFTVLRSGDVTQAQTVHWQIDLTGTHAQDLAASQALTGTLAFAAGATQGVIEVQIAGHATLATNETFAMKLTSFDTGSADTGATPTPLTLATTGTILAAESPTAPVIPVTPSVPAGSDMSSFMQHLVGVGSAFDGLFS